MAWDNEIGFVRCAAFLARANICHRMLKQIAEPGLFLMMGVSMNAGAGLFEFSGTCWKEEVLLHDGSKIIVERSQSYNGQHETGQQPPIREHTITFSLPDSGKAISWTSEYGEDIGRTNFNLLALHILNGTPYLVVEPNSCQFCNKQGRPTPPCVFFKYGGKEWQPILHSEFPAEFKTGNLMGAEPDYAVMLRKSSEIDEE